jgi:hypothetical protein
MGSIGGLIFGKRVAQQVIENKDIILPEALIAIYPDNVRISIFWNIVKN